MTRSSPQNELDRSASMPSAECNRELHDKLLRALSVEGAYACPDFVASDTVLRVATPGKGISLGGFTAPRSAGEALVAQGLAQWQKATRSGVDRLVILQTGRARFARLDPKKTSNDPFQAQHRAITSRAPQDSTSQIQMRVNAAESPLAWLMHRKDRNGKSLLSVEQFAAGERFRAELTNANILPHTSSNWSANHGSGPASGSAVPFSEAAVAARQRLDRALAVLGPDMSGLMIDICGFLKGLEVIEQERHWRQRSAKIVLRQALDRLVRHYGLAGVAIGKAADDTIRHWGQDDFRPQLPAL